MRISRGFRPAIPTALNVIVYIVRDIVAPVLVVGDTLFDVACSRNCGG
jgi:hypothetical protein